MDNLLVGRWRLVSFYSEDQASGERRPTLGASPTGRLIITADGYVMVILTGEGRTPAKTDAEHAQAFRSMFAYSGRYTFDGKSFATDVDLASVAEWVGGRQVRECVLQGSRVQFISKWAPSPFYAGRTTRGIIEFERET